MVKTLQSCVPFNLSSKLKDYNYEKCSGYEAVVYHDGNVDYVLLSIDYGRDVRYYVLNAGAVIMRDDYYEKVEISFDEKTETVEKKLMLEIKRSPFSPNFSFILYMDENDFSY